MAVTSEGRVALYLQDLHPLRDAIEYVRHAEARGFEAVWQAESRLVREATVPMAAFAATTERIRIGSGVVNCWTRNVGLMAMTALNMDRMSEGRFFLGLGTSGRLVVEDLHGERFAKPLTRMREYIDVVRRLIAMENVTFHGAFVDVEDIEIDIVHGDRSPRPVPIYLGATGDRMLELAGEIADGVLLNYLVSPGYNTDAMERVAAGAQRAGRSIDDIDRPQLVVCSLDEDRELALDRARELVTQYLGQQPHIGKASGVDQSLLDEIGEVLTWPAGPEEIRKAMTLVPDDVVQMVSASGTPDECRAKVREYVDAGCTCPVLYPLGDDVRAMIDAFADGAF